MYNRLSLSIPAEQVSFEVSHMSICRPDFHDPVTHSSHVTRPSATCATYTDAFMLGAHDFLHIFNMIDTIFVLSSTARRFKHEKLSWVEYSWSQQLFPSVSEVNWTWRHPHGISCLKSSTWQTPRTSKRLNLSCHSDADGHTYAIVRWGRRFHFRASFCHSTSHRSRLLSRCCKSVLPALGTTSRVESRFRPGF